MSNSLVVIATMEAFRTLIINKKFTVEIEDVSLFTFFEELLK